MINLKKGSSISLEKDGKKLEHVYVGLNWGKISKYWGLIKEDVDLDGSVTMLSENNEVFDTVYFNKRSSNDRSVTHSGDDRGGDSFKDDRDNEVISIDLKKVSSKVNSIYVFLNSYRGQQFHTIPYANIRLLEGNAKEMKKVFATFSLASEPEFKGKVTMIMAKIVRDGANWKFVTIGDAVNAKKIRETVDLIRHHYV